MTVQRQIIYNIVTASSAHPSAESVFLAAKKQMPSIAMGTVYRNLAILTESGLIRRIKVADMPDRYDKTLVPHDHIICRCCGRVEDISPVFTEAVRCGITAQTEYSEVNGELSVLGICPSCNHSEVKKGD